MIADLRRMLSMVLERNAVQIELDDRSHGVRAAVIPDAELARTASFVLAVNAQMPAEHCARASRRSRSSGRPTSSATSSTCSCRASSCARCRWRRASCRSTRASTTSSSTAAASCGSSSRSSGSLAMHVAGDFPGLELELWAIRQ